MLSIRCLTGPSAINAVLVRETDSTYRCALELATEAMGPSNGVRLGVALNYSVFLYELANAEDRACHMARQVRHTHLAYTPNSEENKTERKQNKCQSKRVSMLHTEH